MKRDYFDTKYFKTRAKAKRFAEKVGGQIFYYGPRSSTRFDYIEEMTFLEDGYFDETAAELFPYMVRWLKDK